MTEPLAKAIGGGYTLRGRDAVVIGEVVRAGSAQVGVAMCLGGAPKGYRFVDPNEDAVMAWGYHCRLLLGLADAHNGATAGDVALDWLKEHGAELVSRATPSDWAVDAERRFSAVELSIRQENGRRGARSQTTFLVAVVILAERRLYYAAVGDSHLMIFRGEAPRWLVGSAGNQDFFLGAPPGRGDVVPTRLQTGFVALAPGAAVVLASDGISTVGIGFDEPLAAVGEVVCGSGSLDACELAGQIATAACQVQARKASGDNIGVAVALT